jgi:hypothetical protein
MPGQMQPGQMQPGMMPGMGGMPGQMPQGTPNNGAFGQPPSGGGPLKTVALQSSEGVVSVARAGGGGVAAAPMGQQVIQGASTLYWIVCLFSGVAVGVLAYVVYLQTQ